MTQHPDEVKNINIDLEAPNFLSSSPVKPQI